MLNKKHCPIGFFDSGFGGLTILKEVVKLMPEYDYVYLGDNARAPYGSRSFESVYEYTLECVKKLFEMNCELVILACNTASAKALRTIQQKDLPQLAPNKRVLGVIRPTAEVIGNYSKSNAVGIMATSGTVNSESYLIEINKFFPDTKVVQQACPMLVPLIENNEIENDGADYFIKKYCNDLLKQNNLIDTVLLGCTHYPLIINKIKEHLPSHIQVISQGEIVANSLKDYLNRHKVMDDKISKQSSIEFFTTDDAELFNKNAFNFFGKQITSNTLKW
jgi:glutamate racemase